MTETTQRASDPDDVVRNAALEGRLAAQQCNDCGALIYYPRRRCPGCFSPELRWRELSGEGHVVAWTTPAGQPDTVVVIVELDSGLRVTGGFRTTEGAAVNVGMPVTWVAPSEAQAREGSILNFAGRDSSSSAR